MIFRAATPTVTIKRIFNAWLHLSRDRELFNARVFVVMLQCSVFVLCALPVTCFMHGAFLYVWDGQPYGTGFVFMLLAFCLYANDC